MPCPLLSVENIGKKFQDQWIFQALNFKVSLDETIVLMGESGEGKSLLLKIIAGLIRPDHGKIRLNCKNIGMLFQRNALFDSLTVEENLIFPLEYRIGLKKNAARERAYQYLEFVGLLDFAGNYPDELSGGMQKRLGIARALVLEPDLILCDDPTAGLDPITSRWIVELLQNLKLKTSSTLLMVTHDLCRAFQIATRIYLLSKGELIDGGPPAQFLKSDDQRIQEFISSGMVFK